MELVKTGVAGTFESGDITIEIDKRESGGITIDLDSTVANQFGAQIQSVIEQAARDCGVLNAHVRAIDKGALDCTVRARVTAAIYRGAERDDFHFE